MSQRNSTKHHSTNKTPINDILQNICLQKKKTSNTKNSAQVNFKYKQSSNNNLTTASSKTHDNNIIFDNLNYKHMFQSSRYF